MEASSNELRKGTWSAEEDNLLRQCIDKYGEGKWHLIPLRAGLNRCGKSCRLRWLNYLEPSIKRGKFNSDEVDLLLRLHKLLGNRWSLIAGRLPGRTANDVKNYWNTHFGKKEEICRKIKTRKREMTCSDTSSPTQRLNMNSPCSAQPEVGFGDIRHKNDEKRIEFLNKPKECKISKSL